MPRILLKIAQLAFLTFELLIPSSTQKYEGKKDF